MPYFRHASSPDQLRNPATPRRLYAAPAGYHAVRLASPEAAMVHPVEQFAEVFSANPEQRPPRDWISLLDDEQVGIAAVAVRAVLEDDIRLGLTPPRSGAGGYLRYPSVHCLEAAPGPGVRLVDRKSMEEMTLALPGAAGAAVEMLRGASISRLSHVVANPLILHADPCALATESTETVIKLKIATVLVCLIWRELNGQSCRLCQEVKEECFALVVGQCVNKLLEVARSLGDASWCACPDLPHPCSRDHGSSLPGFCASLGSAMLIWLWTSPPPPWYDSPEGLRGLAAAVVAALIILLLLRHPPRFADQEEFPDSSIHILATPAPEIQLRQTRINGSLLDASQVEAVFHICSVSMEEDTSRPILASSPSRAESPDSDGGGSSSSDGEIRSNLWYRSVHDLEAGVNHLVLTDYIHQLQEMIRGLSEADAVDTVRRAFRDVQKDDGFYRLSDAIEDQWILHADTGTNADSRVLIGRSTGTLVIMSKITAKLLRLIWFELDGQNWQFCQEVKEECFREVAGQSVEKLLDFALSFSNAKWSADNASQMLLILDAHVDVLYNIRDLPFTRTDEFIHNEVADRPDLPLNRYESIHNVTAHIFCKMLVDFRGVLEGTTYDIHRRRESAIHQATAILKQFLEFLYRNGEMMRSVLGTGHCTIEFTIIGSWVSKLKEDAETMFQEKGQRYIFILNNIYYVYEVKDRPGGFLSNIELQESVYSLLQKYRKIYLDTHWVPLTRYLDGDFPKKPRLSTLNKFTEEFKSICRRERTWKVRTGLKKILREDIVDLVVLRYANLLETLQTNPSSHWPSGLKGICRARSEEPQTGLQVEEAIRFLFER